MLARAHAKQHAGHNQERGHTGAPTLTRPAGTSTHTHTILLDTGREHEHELRAQRTCYGLNQTLEQP